MSFKGIISALCSLGITPPPRDEFRLTCRRHLWCAVNDRLTCLGTRGAGKQYVDSLVHCALRVRKYLITKTNYTGVWVRKCSPGVTHLNTKHLTCVHPSSFLPHWGAADAEIKVSSGEDTELKRSPFKAWSRSVYSHTCYAFCQGFLSCLFLHFGSIHLHFFKNFSRFFPVLAVANTWFLCRPTE